MSNQIKIMPFIQTSVAQSQSDSTKATTLYVFNMSLFLVVCVLNRWQRARVLIEVKADARLWPSPRDSVLHPDSVDDIAAEVEVKARVLNSWCGGQSLDLKTLVKATVLTTLLLQKKARVLTTPRNSKPLFCD